MCRSIKRLEPLLQGILALKKVEKIAEEELEKILLDATEQPIQRPRKGQKKYYAGKKKCHTIKTEVQITSKGRILDISKPAPGSEHDFSMRKRGKPLPEKSEVLADSGYQGLDKIHKKTRIPKRKKKGKEGSLIDIAYNRKLAGERIFCGT